MKRRLIVPVLLVLAAGACRREQGRGLPRSAAAARVGELLYGANLIADPEVGDQVRHYIIDVDRDHASSDSVLRELQPWLEEWARRHPDRAARARMMPRPPDRSIRQGSSATSEHEARPRGRMQATP